MILYYYIILLYYINIYVICMVKGWDTTSQNGVSTEHKASDWNIFDHNREEPM